MMKLYNLALSGHAHRALLALSLLGIAHETVEVDLPGGEHKTPAFLAINPFGQVPVLEDEGVYIADSNAILVYLAKKFNRSDWLPEDALGAAQVQRWLSVAAGQIAFGPARARLKTVFKANIDADDAIARANALLAVMDAELQRAPWLTGDAPTIADVSAYSYVAHAPEGNVSLQPYPHVLAWLARIEALPGFVPMPATAVGLAAKAVA